ncbi:hypothetical protein SRAA_1990 [Serpentinimonas raichei]|uniref:EAL domain-containing protein n=2 Tax=Serpentinimonas raichei TaxID=1458425 RepID=A0A060NSK3_9BURK|nr:hypothetical protein SRAA_1990 [Serpentinimonas raichei]
MPLCHTIFSLMWFNIEPDASCLRMTIPRPDDAAHPSATQHPSARRWATQARVLRRGLLCALLWIWVAEASLHFAIEGLGMSLIWPANGVALGAVLAYGPAMIPALALGVVVWHIWHSVGELESLIGIGALVLALLLAWGVLRWLYPRLQSRNPLLQTASFHLLAVLPASAVLTLLGSWQFLLLDAPAWADFEVLILMALSQVFGLLMFGRATQLLLNALKHRAYPWRSLLDRQTVAWCSLFVVFGLLAHLADYANLGSAEAVRYLLLGLVAWAAFAARPLLAHWATAAAAVTMVALAPEFPTADAHALTWIIDQTVLLIFLAAIGFLVSAVMAQRRLLERALRRAAHTDPVTGRLNESGLIEHLRLCAPPPTLLGVEASNLSQIEDRFDLALARSVERDISLTLGQLVPSGSQISRMKEGFFVLCLRPGWASEGLVEGIQQALEGKRYAVAGESTRLRLAIGRLDDVGHPLQAEHRLALLAQATQVDWNGRSAATRDPAQPENLLRLRRQQIECIDHLRELLRQPQADATTGLWLACQPIRRALREQEEVGAEVLLRWTLANGNSMSPAEFFPMAERHGLAAALDRWVLNAAATQVRPLAHGRDKNWKLSVNLSGASVSDPALFDDIVAAIAASGLGARQWCFEITETAGIAQRAQAVELFQRLRQHGASTALDDFGTGLATFDYLKALEADYLKIDGSFVRAIETSRVDQQIVRSICEVARTMRLQTIAEFVERDSQKHLLAAYGVDFVQGYGIARPRPLSEHVQQLLTA